MFVFVENCKYYEVFFSVAFSHIAGFFWKIWILDKFMSGHSIAEHLKFIEKRDNKSVKKQGVKNKIYKTLFFFQNNNKSTITKMLLHFQLINSNWIDTFAFLKSSLEMILLSYYLQKISLPF